MKTEGKCIFYLSKMDVIVNYILAGIHWFGSFRVFVINVCIRDIDGSPVGLWSIMQSLELFYSWS